MVCLRPGYRSRLIYRTVVYRGRRGDRKSFTEGDYARLWTAAHIQLDAPIVAVWDNLGRHVSARMREFITAHADWLTVFQLPGYAPELNPAEGVWANMKTSIGNLAVTGIDHLVAIVKNRLRHIQYRPDLLDGFLAETGLSIEAPKP